MKKFISSLVSVALLAATIVLPASAETEDYADYTTWEVTAVNRIAKTGAYHVGDLIGTGAGHPADTGATGYAQYVFDASEMAKHMYKMGFNGTSMVAGIHPAITADYYNWTEWKENTDYVVKFDLKNNSTEGVTPTFLIHMRSYNADETVDAGSVAKYEWAPVDVTVTGDETQEFIKTFKTGDTNAAGIALRMGFGTGETVSGYKTSQPAEGSAVGVKTSTMYIAEEQIAEIKNEALGSNIITAGGSLKAKAQIVNQLGTTGNIAQEFTYMVLDADRTGLVEDISIVPGDDGEYTINVGENVAEGNYVILARAGQSTDEKLLQKGLEISVVNPDEVDWTDHATAEVTALNRIARSSRYHLGEPYLSGAGNPMDTDKQVGGFAQYTYDPAKLYDNGTGFNGNVISGTKSGSLSEDYYNWTAWKANTNYVVKFDFKNFSPEGVYPTFVMYMRSYETDASTGSAVQKRDWAIVDINVSGDETQEFAHTFTTGDANAENILLRMGYGTGNTLDGVLSPKTAEGSIVGLKVSSMYIAEEQIAEIKNEAPAKIFAGESGKGKVEVVNQVGYKGKIPQDHALLVLNADRTEIAEGVTAVKGANGEYTINVDENAASGEYVVLATATNTGDVFLQKGATIEVVNFAELDLSDNAKIAAEDINPNRFTSYSPANHFTDRNDPPVDVAYISGTSWVNYTLAEGTRANAYATSGTMLYNNAHLDAAYYNWYEFQPNTNYAISFDIKNMSAEGIIPKFGIALRYKNEVGGGNQFDLEIVDVTSTTGQEFKTTLTMGNIVSCGSIGFPDSLSGTSTPIGSSVYLNFDTAYIGVEQAAEITNAATSSTIVMPGETISAKAEILNQVGAKGKLAQDVEFMVLDGDRTEKIDDITVTEGENGAYTINVPETAAAGDYVVLAMNDAAGLQLGLEFTVVDSFADTAVAAAPKNMFVNPAEANHYRNRFGALADITSDGSTEVYTWTPDVTIYNTLATNGSIMPSSSETLAFNWKQIEADSDYLVTFKMKNLSADGITPKFGIDFTSSDGTTTCKDFEIVEVTEREDWQEFKAIFHSTVDGTTTSRFVLGYPTGGTINGEVTPVAVEGSVVGIDRASMSITKLTASQVKVTEVAGADELTFKAEVINQLGTTEGISKQNFTWFAMNEERTERVDGITLTPSADTTTVTVEFAEDVADGTYSIVAVSEDYGMVKGYDYTKAPEVPKEFAVTGTEWSDINQLTVACEGIPAAGKTVLVYFAKYLASAFVGAEVKPVEFDGTNETESKPAEFTIGNGYDSVKAFVWDEDMNALVEAPVNW